MLNTNTSHDANKSQVRDVRAESRSGTQGFPTERQGGAASQLSAPWEQLVTVDLSNCQADVSYPSVHLCSSYPRASTEVLSYDRIGLGNLIAYLCL